MAAMAMTHTTRAVKSAAAGFTAPATTDTVHRARVALANASGALAVNTAALTMSALCMNVLTVGVLGMQRCLV